MAMALLLYILLSPGIRYRHRKGKSIVYNSRAYNNIRFRYFRYFQENRFGERAG
jgi:hypothetical protein